ncbi:hypothetical protein BRC96_03390 [Halobacteriales archaeon QS_6_64_34]|nr:MAG: hypothetical protein BRC96_03390 [Halobacteriales archaeon QS_6_64_34]
MLPVHINREAPQSLAVPDSFEASDSFDMRLVNHGGSCHVHIHLDDALSEQAAIDVPNHHVDGNGERLVRVTRIGDGTARGKLKVVTAYGATTRYVDLQLTEPVSTDEPVIVGEELSKPQPRPAESSPFERRPEILVGVVLLLGLTVGTVALFQNAVLVLGVVVLVVGVVAALVVARSD